LAVVIGGFLEKPEGAIAILLELPLCQAMKGRTSGCSREILFSAAASAQGENRTGQKGEGRTVF
jgi:hypothetical protein